jgi:peptidoglycan hydrolase FlgJ
VSIQPPSDIVLDVAQAADPVKSTAATQRLTQMSVLDGTSGDFSGVLKNLSVPLDNTANLRTRLGLIGGSPGGTSASNAADARTKAYKGLAALIFQNLFETTLPHDASMGKGMAGDVWRSMLAEQLGKQTADVVDLGLLPKIKTAHNLDPGSSPLRRNIEMQPLVSNHAVSGSSS